MSKSVYKVWVAETVKKSPAISTNHSKVIDMVFQAISLFKEYENPLYYNFKGRKIKRPHRVHSTSRGRYNQREARTILISGLIRAWSLGSGVKATISKKNSRDSPFVIFATEVFKLVGIGNVHKHLEEYTSIRKSALIMNKSIED